MFNRILKFFKRPKSKFDFEIANLKDVSSYSFDELSVLLKDFNFTMTIENDLMFVKYESEFSYLEIQYTQSGKFIKIVDQYWK